NAGGKYMRLLQRARADGWRLACLLMTAALAGGCGSIIHGKPVASPNIEAIEPSLPKAMPSEPSPTTTSQAEPPSPTLPNRVIPLPPNENGYVFVQTKSGQTRCQINADNVGCQAQFTNSPIQDGEHANGVNITASGSVQWVLGNLGDIPTM